MRHTSFFLEGTSTPPISSHGSKIDVSTSRFSPWLPGSPSYGGGNRSSIKRPHHLVNITVSPPDWWSATPPSSPPPPPLPPSSSTTEVKEEEKSPPSKRTHRKRLIVESRGEEDIPPCLPPSPPVVMDYPISDIHVMTLPPSHPDFAAQFRRALAEFGYVVVLHLVPPPECARLMDAFLNYLHKVSPAVLPSDPRTWTPDALPHTVKDVLVHYNAGFQPHSLGAMECVKPVFEQLWGTETPLWSSFQGTVMARTKHTLVQTSNHFRWKSLEDWQANYQESEFHLTQTSPGFTSVQCTLSLCDQQADDDLCFACVPRSHLVHDLLLSSCHGKKCRRKHWERVGREHWEYLSANGFNTPAVRVPLPKGSALFWDSRLIHTRAAACATSRATYPLAVQLLVSMSPIPSRDTTSGSSRVVALEVKKRRQAYENRRTSFYSADRIRIVRATPPPTCKRQCSVLQTAHIPPCAPLTLDQQRLLGLVLPESRSS